jgi:AraC-like DNA-binding protein
MKIYIKNMVCDRCKMIVKAELDNIGVSYFNIKNGEVTLKAELSAEQHTDLSNALLESGLELVEGDQNFRIEELKRAITDLALCPEEELKTCYSDYISARLKCSFSSLDYMFSEIEGITIEKYIINHKIELIKELLIHNNLNLSEIALKMHYSSKAQLSSQFKSITGLTPSNFRLLRHSCNHHTVGN